MCLPLFNHILKSHKAGRKKDHVANFTKFLRCGKRSQDKLAGECKYMLKGKSFASKVPISTKNTGEPAAAPVFKLWTLLCKVMDLSTCPQGWLLRSITLR